MRTSSFPSFVLVVALLVPSALAWAEQAARVHYDLSVRIDGAELRGHGVITLPAGTQPHIVVAAPFRIDSLQRRDGKAEVRWRGRLPGAPGGVFLPASSGWHPEVRGELASYDVRLDLPAPQVGVVPGTLASEAWEQGRYRARFAFPHAAPGIDLIVGPYQVAERFHDASGRRIRLRTYFHQEIAALSSDYLDSLGGYLDLYSRQIGEYPFAGFSVVSSPTPTGFGMASLAYLGIDVLRLPFIRATSLGHEVLHNWWGNGVYPDYRRGNWSEGLTTFMADYAYQERAGETAARDMRLGWLRDIAALPASEDFPVRSFTSRSHSASQIVGYGKTAMLFFVLRESVGAEAFMSALRELWRSKQFQVAGWDDLQRAFERASGRDLSAFFFQWLDRRGTPQVSITQASARKVASGWHVRFSLSQDSSPIYALRIPMVLATDTGNETRVIELSEKSASVQFDTAARPRELLLDPDARMLRRLAASEAPPILRRVAVDPQLRTVIASDSASAVARTLARTLSEHPLRVLPAAETPGEAPILLVGLEADVDAWLAKHRLAARPATLAANSSAQVWTAVRERGAPIAVVSARDAGSLEALVRPLRHYGRQSFIVFDGAKAMDRGVWPARPQSWRFDESG